MKFCKNLQRVVDISDPEWAPYWTNYKMLKKLIKELPSLVPSEEANRLSLTRTRAPSTECVEGRDSASESLAAGGESPTRHSGSSGMTTEQNQGDETAEVKREVASLGASSGAAAATVHHNEEDEQGQAHAQRNDMDTIGKSPGEVAFFKLLHAEFKKATHFFERAQQEYIIREERVRNGMELMKQPNSIMVSEKWSLLAKSIYRLYKDLLLLETFAIMTYCGFSKILKKHDKVTGYNTRNAFMTNIVNNANFSNYPKVLEMISRCEQLYEEVSNRLVQDGKHGLYEDERLFINMIHRLNEQVMEGVEGEGAPGRMEPRRQSVSMPAVSTTSKESWATSSLRQLVNENDASRLAGQVSETNEGNPGVDSDADEDDRKQEASPPDDDCRKRRASSPGEAQGERKRQKGCQDE